MDERKNPHLELQVSSFTAILNGDFNLQYLYF